MPATNENHSRGQLDATFEAERRAMSEQQRDVHACRRLWRSVLERTVDDIRFLHRTAKRAKLKKHEEERLRRIRENPPADFIRGTWFAQICEYLDVDAKRIRNAIQRVEAEATAA